MAIMGIMAIMGVMGIMASITSIAICATTVDIITAAIRTIVGMTTAVIIVTPAPTIETSTGIDAIGAATISTATIDPMAEITIATNLQAGFTPTRQGGMGLVTAKRKVRC